VGCRSCRKSFAVYFGMKSRVRGTALEIAMLRRLALYFTWLNSLILDSAGIHNPDLCLARWNYEGVRARHGCWNTSSAFYSQGQYLDFRGVYFLWPKFMYLFITGNYESILAVLCYRPYHTTRESHRHVDNAVISLLKTTSWGEETCKWRIEALRNATGSYYLLLIASYCPQRFPFRIVLHFSLAIWRRDLSQYQQPIS
jgi:hypothetical protein